jgi:hypothetical protein
MGPLTMAGDHLSNLNEGQCDLDTDHNRSFDIQSWYGRWTVAVALVSRSNLGGARWCRSTTLGRTEYWLRILRARQEVVRRRWREVYDEVRYDM